MEDDPSLDNRQEVYSGLHYGCRLMVRHPLLAVIQCGFKSHSLVNSWDSITDSAAAHGRVSHTGSSPVNHFSFHHVDELVKSFRAQEQKESKVLGGSSPPLVAQFYQK